MQDEYRHVGGSKKNHVEWRGRRRSRAANTNRWRRGERTSPTNNDEDLGQFVEKEGLVAAEGVSGKATTSVSQGKVKINNNYYSNRVVHHRAGKGGRRKKAFNSATHGCTSEPEELELYSNDGSSTHRQQRANAENEKRAQTKNAGKLKDYTRKGCYPTLNFHNQYSITQLVLIQEKMQLLYLRHTLLQANTKNRSSLLGVSCLWPLSVPRDESKMLPWLSSSTRFLEVPTVLQLSTERVTFVLDILKLSEDRRAMKEFGRVMKEVMACRNLIKLVFDPQRSIDAFASTWGEYDGWEQPWWEAWEPVINMRSFAESRRRVMKPPSDEESLSLSYVCKSVLNLTTSEQQRLTDWGKRPLSPSQVAQAAVEARCLLEIYDVLMKEQHHMHPGGEPRSPPVHQCLKPSYALQSRSSLAIERNGAAARRDKRVQYKKHCKEHTRHDDSPLLHADAFWHFLMDNPSLMHEDRFKLEKVFHSPEYKDWFQERHGSTGRQTAWQGEVKCGSMKKSVWKFRDVLHSLYLAGRIQPRNNEKTILQFIGFQDVVKPKEGKCDGDVCSNIGKDNRAEQQRQKETGSSLSSCGVEVSYLNFGDLEKEPFKQHILSITNTSQEIRTLVAIETPEPIPGLSIAGLRGSLLQMPMDVAPEQSIQLSFTITASKCDGPVHRKVIFKFDGFEIVRFIDLDVTGKEHMKPDQASQTYVRQLKKCVVYGKAFCVRAAETLPDLPPDDFEEDKELFTIPEPSRWLIATGFQPLDGEAADIRLHLNEGLVSSMYGRSTPYDNKNQESIMLRSTSAAAAVTTIIITAALLVSFSCTEFWKQRGRLKRQNAELSSGFERLVLSIDIGSSGVRCGAYSLQNPVNLVKGSLTSIPAPEGGFIQAEKGTADAMVIRETVERCMDESLSFIEGVGLGRRVIAISFSTFAMSLVGLDAFANPVTPVYTYAQSGHELGEATEQLKAFLGEELEKCVYDRTGSPIHCSYAAPRLLHLLENEQEQVRMVKSWSSISSYLLMNWTRTVSCSPNAYPNHIPLSFSEASWMGLLDHTSFRDLQWDSKIFEFLQSKGLRLSTFPPLVDFDEFEGRIASDSETGIRWPALVGAKIYLGIGDGACANIGSGSVDDTTIAVTVGTSAAVRMVVDRMPSVDYFSSNTGLFCYRIDKRRVLVGGALSDGGGCSDWMFDILGADTQEKRSNLEMQALLEAPVSPPPVSLLMLPFLSGERAPGWDGSATGSVLGLRKAVTRPMLLRAAVEGVALRLSEIVRRMGIPADTPAVASGKALSSSQLWLQTVSNALGRRVLLSKASGAEALYGAATLAAEKYISNSRIPAATEIGDIPYDMKYIAEPDPAQVYLYVFARDMQSDIHRNLVRLKRLSPWAA